MQVVQKNWQVLNDHFLKAYRRYHIHKKSTAAAHGYGASENHAHETDAQVMTSDALQALANATIKNKEEM